MGKESGSPLPLYMGREEWGVTECPQGVLGTREGGREEKRAIVGESLGVTFVER